jgi:putative ABC transport system substrate-binding protein
MRINVLGRRDFLAVLGGAAVSPLATRAQSAMPIIGFLDGQSPNSYLMTPFRQALQDAGYVEGRNVLIEYRSAYSQTDRLVSLAGDLVIRSVSVIVATGGTAAAIAAYATTTRIPIVFASDADPVTSGLVIGLNRPDGNATGVYVFQQVLEGKRLGLLHELVPTAPVIAVLLNPSNANFQAQLRGVQEAARAGGQVNILSASTDREIETAFAIMTDSRAGALLVGSDPFFSSRVDQIVAAASRHRIPAIYEARDFAMAGGLASYGPNLADAHRQVGIYTGQILKGAKPADLPVVQAARFEFVINLRTAQALGLDVSSGLSAGADEIIE